MKIEHVAVYVSDLEKTRDFFEAFFLRERLEIDTTTEILDSCPIF
jgi:catechol 2,3-dioxygenase-like lactoylglutathione lyase family enzyme